MNDPLFAYFERERDTVSRHFYGPETRFKEYPRFPRVALPAAAEIDAPLSSLLFARRTTRQFAKEPVTLDAFNLLVYWSLGSLGERTGTEHPLHRPHPSGGARYPIECYPIILNVEGVARGVYHYNVPKHALEQIANTVEVSELVQSFRYDFLTEAAFVLCFTYMKSRQIKRYGGFAYKVGIIEAGHIGQNVYLTTGALGLGCCALGGGDEESMYRMLGIDGGNEHIVYAVAVGRKA